jgi:hypothetical protein
MLNVLDLIFVGLYSGWLFVALMWSVKGLHYEPSLTALSLIHINNFSEVVKFFIGAMTRGGTMLYVASYLSFLMVSMKSALLLIPIYSLWVKKRYLVQGRRYSKRRICRWQCLMILGKLPC